MQRCAGLALAALWWTAWLMPTLAQTGSRYSAPLWTWITAIIVAAGLSVAGFAIGLWFLRKRARINQPE